jgi:hypothetical protein
MLSCVRCVLAQIAVFTTFVLGGSMRTVAERCDVVLKAADDEDDEDDDDEEEEEEGGEAADGGVDGTIHNVGVAVAAAALLPKLAKRVAAKKEKDAKTLSPKIGKQPRLAQRLHSPLPSQCTPSAFSSHCGVRPVPVPVYVCTCVYVCAVQARRARPASPTSPRRCCTTPPTRRGACR